MINYAELINCTSAKEVQQAVLEWSSNKSKQAHLINSAILEIHANLEREIKEILYEALVDNICLNENKELVENSKISLWRKILKLSFSQSYSLLKPALDSFVSPDLKHIPEINTVRNLTIHGDIDKVLYKNRNPFSDHDCLAQIFFEGWAARKALSKYYEVVIDSRRYNCKKYAKFYFEHQ